MITFRIVDAGAEGLVVYQETYNREIYAEMHTAGPKRDFNFRLDCAERGYAAGFRRLGIGALFGLSRWQDEAVALAAHLGVPAETLLAGANQRESAAIAPGGRRVSPAFFHDRSRAGAIGLRVANHVSAGRDRA